MKSTSSLFVLALTAALGGIVENASAQGTLTPIAVSQTGFASATNGATVIGTYTSTGTASLNGSTGSGNWGSGLTLLEQTAWGSLSLTNTGPGFFAGQPQGLTVTSLTPINGFVLWLYSPQMQAGYSASISGIQITTEDGTFSVPGTLTTQSSPFAALSLQLPDASSQFTLQFQSAFAPGQANTFDASTVGIAGSYVAPAPEPTTIALAGFGCLAFALYRRKK